MGRPRNAVFLVSMLLLATPSGSPAAAGVGIRERTLGRETAPAAAPGASVRFEENRGQSDPSVRFIARGQGYTGFLTDRGLVLSLREGTDAAGAFRVPLEGPRRVRMTGLSMEFLEGGASLVGKGSLPGYTSYLVGKDRSRWIRRTPSFGGAVARDVWPGIDATWTSEAKNLRYTFRAAPGADSSKIALRFRGADSMRVDESGDLLLESAFGTVRHTRPLAWQESGGRRIPVAAEFDLRTAGTVGFRFGAVDSLLPLVVDPRIDYSTYIGSTGADEVHASAADSSGAIYVAGNAGASNFPIVGGFRGQAQYATSEAFVTKVAAGGASVVYSTFLGGADFDEAFGIAVDSSGRVWVTGNTLSTDFPTASAFQSTLKGYYDAYVTRISAAGDGVEVSTYLGGATSATAQTPGSGAFGLAVDGSGSVYVAGTTGCSDFPTKDAFQASHGGHVYDVFVAKFTVAGALAYSSYLGGNQTDYARSLAVDAQGRAYVVGFTGGGTFPSVNPIAGISGSNTEAFLARVAADGKSLDYSFPFGGTDVDEARAVALGPEGDVFVAGSTFSTNFPVKAPLTPPPLTSGFYTAAYLSRFSSDGTTMLKSNLLAGSESIAYGLAVDSAGGAWVAGSTTDSSFFPVINATQNGYGGGIDAFLLRVNSSGSAITFATFLGGSAKDIAYTATFAGNGNVWCAGRTLSTNFPRQAATLGGYGGGDGDGFLTCHASGPLAPTGLTAAAYTGSGANLSWTDASVDELGFTVQRREPAGAFATVGSVGADVTAFGDGGLSPLTTYEYRVQSVNGEGGSGWSNVATTTTTDVAPASPVLVSAVPLSPSSVRLTWQDKSANETSFEVLYGFPGTTRAVIAGLAAGSTTHDVTGLLPGRTYGFTARGRNDIGAGGSPTDLLATTDPTASFTLVKGTLKASDRFMKDKFSISGTLLAGEDSPDGLFDPVADGIVFRLGGELSPLASVAIPAAGVWKERRGKFTWKSAKGIVPKAIVAFTPATGTFTVKLSKVDFAGAVAAALPSWFATGNDAGLSSADWQEARPGSWRFPAK